MNGIMKVLSKIGVAFATNITACRVIDNVWKDDDIEDDDEE